MDLEKFRPKQNSKWIKDSQNVFNQERRRLKFSSKSDKKKIVENSEIQRTNWLEFQSQSIRDLGAEPPEGGKAPTKTGI